MNKADISKMNITELIELSNKYDQRGMLREADICDKLANHFDKMGMARGVPDDLAEFSRDVKDLKVNVPSEKQKDSNYTELSDLVGESQNNRITMAAEELTRIPTFPAQQSGPKPRGIWYACGNEWISWLTYEMPHWIGDYVYSFKVDESKILMIKTTEEFKSFEREFLDTNDRQWGGRSIDWARVAREYSGIEICPYRGEARYSSDWYYGWDVASGCVWESEAVLEATLVAKRARQIDRESGYPEKGDEANWEWYGLPAGQKEGAGSREAEDIAAEVDERVGDEVQQLGDDLAQQFINDIDSADPWSKPWGTGDSIVNDVTSRRYPKGRGMPMYDDVSQIPASHKGGSVGKTATKVKSLDSFRGDAALYELSEPLDGHEYVVVSASEVPMSGPETYIFGADENGEIIDWAELPGSTPGIMCHNSALKNAGYTIG
jgi:hypothetical protein